MTTDEWFIKAAAYFDGSMTNEEARAFEIETAARDELNQLMILWKRTDAESAAYEQYKPDVEAFINTHQRLKKEFTGKAPAPVVKLPVWKWVAAAAVITGLIIIGKMVLPVQENTPAVVQKTTTDTAKAVAADSNSNNPIKENKSTSPPEKDLSNLETLYAQNFTADDVPDDPNGPLDDAYFYYASRQYKKAIMAIDSTGTKQLTRGGGALSAATKVYADYYKALSLMSLGKEASAIPLLKQVIAPGTPESLKAKARWYLALAYIKQHEPSPAISLFELLAVDPQAGSYKNKARKLLSALKQ